MGGSWGTDFHWAHAAAKRLLVEACVDRRRWSRWLQQRSRGFRARPQNKLGIRVTNAVSYSHWSGRVRCYHPTHLTIRLARCVPVLVAWLLCGRPEIIFGWRDPDCVRQQRGSAYVPLAVREGAPVSVARMVVAVWSPSRDAVACHVIRTAS